MGMNLTLPQEFNLFPHSAGAATPSQLCPCFALSCDLRSTQDFNIMLRFS